MHTILRQSNRPTSARVEQSGIPRTLRDVLSLLALWRGRQRQRRQLARLDRHQLDDIGLTPFEANREIRKPFWQA
jgi:uncharacterized protein YjiS (DUF1127 family)